MKYDNRFLTGAMRGVALVILSAAVQTLAAPATNSADARLLAFQTEVERLQRDSSMTSQEAVESLLTQSFELGRPQAAAAIAKSYLAKHRDPSLTLLVKAAQAAEWSGDLRTAVGRYKQALKFAPNAPTAADTTWRLFRLQVYDLGTPDDAFRQMTEMGDAARSSPALKRFDSWYLSQAMGRKDSLAATRRLAAILSDQMPLDLERQAYWDVLDALMRDLANVRPELYPALPECRRISESGLIRGNDAWSKRFAFLTANLSFAAGSAGKDAAAQAREFDMVARAARAYIDAAPTAAAVREIGFAFSGGWDRYDAAQMAKCGEIKSAVFAYAFGKLDNAQRDAILLASVLNWDAASRIPTLATRDQFARLAAANADYFRQSPATSRIPMLGNNTNVADYKALAPMLQGIPNADALVLAALGSSDDLVGCWRRVVQDSWFFSSFDEVSRTLDLVWPRYQSFPRPEGRLTDDKAERALAKFGVEGLARTPHLLFDISLARASVLAAWRYSGANDLDKSKVAAALHALDWMPFSEKERNEIYGQAIAEFRAWTEAVRSQQKTLQSLVDGTTRELAAATKAREEEAKKPIPALAPLDQRLAACTTKLAEQKAELAKQDAAVSQFSPLEEQFRQVKDAKISDLSKAPDDLCRHLARAMVAVREKNKDAFQEAARALYPLARDYEAKKIPYGRAALRYVLKNRFELFDTLDFQCEVVADQLTRGTPGSGNRLLGEAMGMLGENRGWTKEQSLKVNAVLAKGVRDLLARKQFDGTVFQWFLDTRRGQGWSETDRDQDILETLIKQPELLAGQTDRVIYLMNGIWTHFPKLVDKYPLRAWFEDAFADEIRKRKFVDKNYYLIGGADTKGSAIQAMAEVFAAYDRLPFGYDGGTQVWADRTAFWDFHNKAMGALPASRDTMLTQIESNYGKTRFDYYANGNARLSTLSLDSKERKRYFDLLNAWVEAREREPVKALSASIGPVISAYNDRAHPERRELSAAEQDVLMRLFQLAPEWNWQEFNTFDRILHDALFASKRYKDMFALAPHLWGLARASTVDGDSIRARMVDTTVKLADSGLADLAATYAACGLEIMGNGLKENQRTSLMAIKSKALSGVLATVAVPRSDRRFPLFQAQANFQIGRTEDAWQACLEHHELFIDSYRELDPEFSIWIINKLTEVGNYADAEKYTGLMMQWVDQAPQSFALADRVRLVLAFANIPFQRQEYPKAKAICEQIIANKEYEDVLERYDADMQIAEIDRLTKKYDAAIERLTNLLQKKQDIYVQTEGNYHLALVKLDKDEYPEAKESVEKVLAISPAHINAQILLGKIHLKLKKLIEATYIPLGQAANQRVIVPGRVLRITLSDKNLAVVGRASSIEIRVWSASGDEETFALLPFGDTKTKFEGSIMTALAPMARNDKVLQVLGGDTVYFDYSESFKKANKIVGDAPVGIRVVSDSELYISSGKVVSREESEQQNMDRLIRERLQLDAAAAGKKAPTVALNAIRASDEVKPGNKINIRVIDPGSSTTTNRNRIYVKAVASSGDRINRVELVETAPYSSIFEGSIPTVAAPAMAMALDTDEGKEPGFAITTADYPPWQAMPDNRPPKWFGVDMNTRNTLGSMKIDADVSGRHLRKFLLQSSMNGTDFVSVGAWPENLPTWQGAMRMEVARYRPSGYTQVNDSLGLLRNYRDFLDIGYISAECSKVALAPKSFEVDWEPASGMDGLADRLQIERDGAGGWFIGRLQGTFYQPMRQRLIFRVAGPDPLNPPANCIFVLDNEDSDKGKLQGKASNVRSVSKGMHKVEVYFAGMRKTGLRFWIEVADIKSRTGFTRCSPDMFAPPTNLPPRELAQALQAVTFRPAAITNSANGGVFTVGFQPNTQARAVRLWMLDYEGDAPAIQKLHLTAADGRKILPSVEDVVKLRENNQLEIIPGDKITLSYENQHALNKERQFNEAFMKVTYYNASVNACFVESVEEKDGTRRPQYISMRRFTMGDTVNVFVNDPDSDTNDECNVVTFNVRVGKDGQAKTFQALETAPHSGVFLGKVFPVAGEPQRPAEIHMEPYDDLQFSYLDVENTDPGIPWERSGMVEQAVYVEPEFRISYATSSPLQGGGGIASAGRTDAGKKSDEVFPVRYGIDSGLLEPDIAADTNTLEDVPVFSNVTTTVLGCAIAGRVTWPTIALSPNSRTTMYAQTASGRKKYGKPLEGDFDLNVPGTIRIDGGPGDVGNVTPPTGYAGGSSAKKLKIAEWDLSESVLDLGRFALSVPLALGDVPESSFAVEKPGTVRAPPAPGELDWSSILAVNAGDTVYLGFSYKDSLGTNHWLTGESTLTSDAFFDIMDRKYTEFVTNRNVGEYVYLRVVDQGLDRPEFVTNAVHLQVTTSSGLKQTLPLYVVGRHTGIYKGNAKFAYSEDNTISNQTEAVRVNYGDTVTFSYCSQVTSQTISRTVYIFKGENGNVVSFTKRFKDQSIAVQTQFTLAESYFEMAKKHRELSQPEVARREIAQGKKLLEEAVRDYPASDIRAQADFLLANLSIEYAMQVKDDQQKLKHYLDAITRFTDIVGNFPDGPYAPKSQFRKALTYEKMGRIDEACEEYVKLAYRYPDHELVAETIARLGQYFLGKGKAIEGEFNTESDPVKKEKLRLKSVEMYKTAAQVFGRLSPRFPDHQLAAKTSVLSGQCWMRAKEPDQAIKVFTKAVDAKKGSNELLAEAMYWCGDAYLRRKKSENDSVNAYRMWKRLTWDYPETTWAKYARGRLSEPEMAKQDKTE